MKKSKRIFKFPHSAALIALLCSFWQAYGQGAPGSCTTPINPNQAFPVQNLSYGVGGQLDVNQYDAITLRRGDKVTLLFPCTPVLAEAASSGLTVAISGNSALVTVSTSGVAPGTSLILPFSTPNYEFVVNFVGDVWPGDANADGRRNMHDVMPIALGIREGVSGPSASVLNYPPDPGQMLTFHDIADWPGQSFVLGGKTINFKHADCNLDGQIDAEDLEYLEAVMGPITPPDFLPNTANGLSLKAVYDAVNPIDVSITEDGEMGVRFGFDIEVQDDNSFAEPIFGAVYARPITETAQYKVDNMNFRFVSPNVFDASGEVKMLWGQHFWNDQDVQDASGECAPVVYKPRDVGVFGIDGPLQTLGSAGSARLGNCQVTLIDILRSGEPMPSALDFPHYLMHGVAYTLDNGSLGIQQLACESTSTPISLAQLCEEGISKLLIRDQVQDNGNGSSSHMQAWNSPDIWVRLVNDNGTTHQTPAVGQTVFVKVRVHNPSCTPVTNATVTLYAAAHTAAQQGGDFSSIGTATNVNIPEWGSHTVTIPWKVDPIQGIHNLAATFTLLAKVGSPANPAPSLPSGQLSPVVLSNAMMAMRNSKALREEDGSQPIAEFFMGTTAVTPVKLNLRLLEGSSFHPASEYGMFKIQVGGVLPASLSGCTQVGTDTYQIDPSAQTASLELNPSSNIKVSYEKNIIGSPSGLLTCTYLLWLTVGGIDYPGMTFKISLP